MATAFKRDTGTTAVRSELPAAQLPIVRAVRDARYLLRFVFIVAPIIAGIDKLIYAFSDRWLVADWYQYLWPTLKAAGVNDFAFNLVVGIVEVVAGLIVAFRPDLGGYLVMVWLWAIVINLLLIPGYYDIALRDFGLSLAALSMARLWWPRFHDESISPYETVRQEHTVEYAAPPGA
jgi:hypothetical protein